MTKIKVTKERRLDNVKMEFIIRMVFHSPATLREGDALVFNVHDEFVKIDERPDDYCEVCHGTGEIKAETETKGEYTMVTCQEEIHK